MIAQISKASVAYIAIVLALTLNVGAQEPLTAARDLYASAEYEEALRMLDRPETGKYAGAQRLELELYRAMCLFALGRQAEADRAVETLIKADPLYRPADEIAPRIRAAITATRTRMLPGIIQQQYADAKTAFERQDFVIAAAGFKRVIDSLNDPDIAQAAAASPLADIRVLAGGFQDLSVKSIPPPPPPPPPAPVVQPPPVNLATKIFTGEGGEKVNPPVAIRQDVPQFPGPPRPGGVTGVVEIIISASGRVESASMIEPTTPGYDRMVQMATANWVYQPASVNGTPVKFRKRIRISVPAESPN
jgi:hypothetical protein